LAYTQSMPNSLPVILIIEPDRPTLELYSRALSQEYRLLAASTEQLVLELLKAENPQAVILEPAGLGERGWLLITAIKNASGNRRLPIIVCSILDDRQRGLEMGAAVCLVKPVFPTVLQQVLTRLAQDT